MKLGKYEVEFKKRSKELTFQETIQIRILSVLMGLAAVALIFLAYGHNPLVLYFDVFYYAFFTVFGLLSTLSRFIPLLLIAIGLAVPFRAKIDNIGAEGQFLVGTIAASGVALFYGEGANPFVIIPVMFLAGFLAGALWALPIAIFRVKSQFKGSDVVISFLLFFPAKFMIDYLITGPWRDPEGWGFPQSPLFPESTQIFTFPGTRVHLTIFLALAATFLIYYFLTREKKGIPETKLGYEINVLGENPEAGEAAGMSFLKIAIISVLIPGGLAGLAGVGEVAGNPNFYRLRPELSRFMGFTGIAVAWLGGLNPLGIIVSALFFSGLLAGGVIVQVSGLPVSVVDLFNGSILFFVLIAEFFIRNKIEWGTVS
ncbi:MAG: ABC transporter permease [Candidatus Thorarchaeota archaeon]|nr:ABC transporter permease [Candidatus Thorarchaeota archaeon]